MQLTPEQAERAILTAQRLISILEVFVRHAEDDRDSGRVVYYNNVLKETREHAGELESLRCI